MQRIAFLFSVCTFLFLAACTSDGQTTNVIQEADLTEHEEAILSITTDKSFLFDFKVDDTFEDISIWVEKYEFGELIEDEIGKLTTMIDGSGSIIFTVIGDAEHREEKAFHLGVGDESGSSGTRIDETLKIEEAASVWDNISGSNEISDEEVVLATIGYSSSESSGLSSPGSEFYEDMDANLDRLVPFAVAYVLKAKFLKENT